MPTYILLTILASLCWGVGAGLMKHGVSTQIPKIGISALLSNAKGVFSALIRNRAWAFSILIGIAGGFFMVQAQSMGDLTVVLPLANLACAFSILFGVLFLGERLKTNEGAGLFVLLVGAVLISISASEPASGTMKIEVLWALTLGFLLVIALSLFYARSLRNGFKEFIFSLCTGLFYGLGYIYLKVTTNAVLEELGTFSVLSLKSIIAALTTWSALICILFNVLGFLFMQIAFSHSRVSVSHPLLTIVANMSPTVGGVLVFGEKLTAFRSAGLLAILIGALVVAFSARSTSAP